MRKVSRFAARSGARPIGALALLVVSACSLGTEAADRPTSARVRVEATSTHQLTLVTATDFYEQYSLATGERSAVAVVADTALITLPYDQTLDISSTGSVYVELRNTAADSATVRLRVDLDNGQTTDRTATLLDNAGLVYYYLFYDYAY
jgi:hypothetical protein